MGAFIFQHYKKRVYSVRDIGKILKGKMIFNFPKKIEEIK